MGRFAIGTSELAVYTQPPRATIHVSNSGPPTVCINLNKTCGSRPPQALLPPLAKGNVGTGREARPNSVISYLATFGSETKKGTPRMTLLSHGYVPFGEVHLRNTHGRYRAPSRFPPHSEIFWKIFGGSEAAQIGNHGSEGVGIVVHRPECRVAVMAKQSADLARLVAVVDAKIPGSIGACLRATANRANGILSCKQCVVVPLGQPVFFLQGILPVLLMLALAVHDAIKPTSEPPADTKVVSLFRTPLSEVGRKLLAITFTIKTLILAMIALSLGRSLLEA